LIGTQIKFEEREQQFYNDTSEWVLVKQSKKGKIEVYLDKSKNSDAGAFCWKTTYTIPAPFDIVRDQSANNMDKMQVRLLACRLVGSFAN
jgi:hypothetical protein